MKIAIGSKNQGKVRELAALLEGLPYEVLSLAAFPEVDEPVEDGVTFEENALLKARYYTEKLGVPCIADDSGLVVDAVGGAPGIYSARYAGPECDPVANMDKLLDALSETPWHARTARFVCCAAYADSSGRSHTELGTVEGHIAVETSGDGGFGYDPIFVPDGESRTFAEMTAEEKHAISHRGRAFAKIRGYLEGLA